MTKELLFLVKALEDIMENLLSIEIELCGNCVISFLRWLKVPKHALLLEFSI